MIQMGETVAAAWRLLQNTAAEASASAGSNAVAEADTGGQAEAGATEANTGTGADTPAVSAPDTVGAGTAADGIAGPAADTPDQAGSDTATTCTDTDTVADSDADADPRDAVLAAEAAAAEVRGETAEVLLEVAVACERMISYLHARQVRALAGLSATVAHGSDPHGVDIDPSAPEIACALAWTPGAADARVQLALDLLDLPVVLHALQTARIDLAKARDIIDGSWGLGDADRHGLCALAVAFAAGHTRGQLRAWLTRNLYRIDPEVAAARRKTAQKTRRVRLRPETDGMATLTATLTAAEAAACMEAIRARANSIDGGRDANQADILVELLTGIAAGDPIPVVVMITADGVELPGYGPVSADLAAELLGAGITTTPDEQNQNTDSPYQQRITHDRHDPTDPEDPNPANNHTDTEPTADQKPAPVPEPAAVPDPAPVLEPAPVPEPAAAGQTEHVRPTGQPDTTGDQDRDHESLAQDTPTGPDTAGDPAPPGADQPAPPGDPDQPGDPGPATAARTRPPTTDQPVAPDTLQDQPDTGAAARPTPHMPTDTGTTDTTEAPDGLQPPATRRASCRIVNILNTATPPPAVDRYRPSPHIIRHVRARDRHCRFPGCQQPAVNCDLDHTIAYPNGPTTPANLHCLCRRHHRQKTHTAWTVTTLEGDILQWTSPLGRTYLSHPNDP